MSILDAGPVTPPARLAGMNAALGGTLPLKPIFRGWSHAGAAIAALVATAALAWAGRADPPLFVSLLAYGATLIALYTISALYHIGNWRGRRRAILRAIDHANIYFVIAGTYTPICVNVLSGALRPAVLASIWAVAVVGAVTCLGILRLPRWVGVTLYVAAGWLALIPAPSLVERLPLGAIVLLLTGGAAYTLGAVIYACRRPDPFPLAFGYHEVFHACVIAGSAAFFAVIWIWVIPFPRL